MDTKPYAESHTHVDAYGDPVVDANKLGNAVPNPRSRIVALP